MRKDRVGTPISVTKKNLNKGDMTFASHKGMIVGKWKDKREVLVISNAHVPEMLEVTNRKGKKKIKPNFVRDYNNGMSGIDRSDQMLSCNIAQRRCVRWNKKVGIHLIEMLHNAHYLFKFNTKQKLGITEFKQKIVELVGGIQTPKKIQTVADFHYLIPIPATEKRKTQPENV